MNKANDSVTNTSLKNNISIVLVRPQMGENIGAAARVMANFNFTDMRIVSPRDGWPNEKAVSMATESASGIIKGAKIFQTVEDAIADKQYVYATTARTRGLAVPQINSYQLHEENSLYSKNSAILFGCEQSGLSNHEMKYANAHIYIPTSESSSSCNLSQAVGIICYAINACAKYNSKNRETQIIEKASVQTIDLFANKLFELLTQSGFYNQKQSSESLNQRIVNMLVKSGFSDSDYNLLHGIVRSLSQK